MEKFTQKQLKTLVKFGHAIDATDYQLRSDIDENYTQIGYSSGVYGCNGMLLKGRETLRLYAITGRTTAIYIF